MGVSEQARQKGGICVPGRQTRAFPVAAASVLPAQSVLRGALPEWGAEC